MILTHQRKDDGEMAISDLRNKIRRMEKREMQMIHLLQKASAVIPHDFPGTMAEEWHTEADKILGPNWRG